MNMSSQSFRNIRPSNQSSAGGGGASEVGAESGARGFSPQRSEQAPSTGASGRRRAQPLSVTANACIICKKAKAKCDGKQPCGRCGARNAVCTYETHIKMAKENMVKQIKDLQALLRVRIRDETQTLEETMLCRQVLGAIRDDIHAAEIVEKLQLGESLQSIVDSLGLAAIEGTISFPLIRNDSLPTDVDEMVGVVQDTNSQSKADYSNAWTDTTINEPLRHRLLFLYFKWIHPVHTIFSESPFMDNYSRKLHSHCSSALVNTIFALACRFLEPAETDNLPSKDDVYLLSRRFAAEAQSRLATELATPLTKIQASSILSLVAEIDGDRSRAKAYLDASIDIVERQMADGVMDSEAWKTTLKGIFVLVVTFEENSYEVSDANISQWNIPDLVSKKNVMIEAMGTTPSNAEFSELSNFSAVMGEAKVQISQITADTVRLFYSASNEKICAAQILDLYLRYLTWRDELPDVLKRVEKEDSGFHPHILLLHVQYHVAVFQLLRPCANIEWVGSEKTINPRNIAAESAEMGFQMLQYHRHLYSSTFSTSSQLMHLVQICYGVVQLSDSNGPNNIQSVIRFCFESLNESYSIFGVSAILHESFRRLLVKIDISLTFDVSGPMDKTIRENYDMAGDAFEQPVDTIVARLEVSLVKDWTQQWTLVVNSGVFQRKNDVNKLIRRLSSQRTGKYLQLDALLNSP